MSNYISKNLSWLWRIPVNTVVLVFGNLPGWLWILIIGILVMDVVRLIIEIGNRE